MYGHSQRGVCSVAPLTLPSRELSRACVYLPLFVLRSPRPRRENTSGGRREQESRGAAQTTNSDPRHNQNNQGPKTQWTSSGWLQTAALSHPMTCEEALRFLLWWRGAPVIESEGPHKDWQKPLVKEGHQKLNIILWHLPCTAKTEYV